MRDLDPPYRLVEIRAGDDGLTMQRAYTRDNKSKGITKTGMPPMQGFNYFYCVMVYWEGFDDKIALPATRRRIGRSLSCLILMSMICC